MKTLQVNDDFEITTGQLADEMGIKHGSLIRILRRYSKELFLMLPMEKIKLDNYNVAIINRNFLVRSLDNYPKLSKHNIINAIHGFILKNQGTHAAIRNRDGSLTPINHFDDGSFSLYKYKDMAKKWLETIEHAERMEQEKNQMERVIEEREPLYEFGKTLAKSESLISVQDVAKSLHITNIFKLLHSKGIFHYKFVANNKTENKGRSYGVPKKEFIDRGYFELKQGTYDTPKGETRTYLKPMVTAKGELFIQRLFMESALKLIGG